MIARMEYLDISGKTCDILAVNLISRNKSTESNSYFLHYSKHTSGRFSILRSQFASSMILAALLSDHKGCLALWPVLLQLKKSIINLARQIRFCFTC